MKVVELPKPRPAASLLEAVEELRKQVESGEVRAVVILVADKNSELAYSEGGEVHFPTVLFHFELWKKDAIYHGG
jgi:acetyl-CoA acetyltransferase